VRFEINNIAKKHKDIRGINPKRNSFFNATVVAINFKAKNRNKT
jgi:hypothetical protein